MDKEIKNFLTRVHTQYVRNVRADRNHALKKVRTLLSVCNTVIKTEHVFYTKLSNWKNEYLTSAQVATLECDDDYRRCNPNFTDTWYDDHSIFRRLFGDNIALEDADMIESHYERDAGHYQEVINQLNDKPANSNVVAYYIVLHESDKKDKMIPHYKKNWSKNDHDRYKEAVKGLKYSNKQSKAHDNDFEYMWKDRNAHYKDSFRIKRTDVLAKLKQDYQQTKTNKNDIEDAVPEAVQKPADEM